MFCIFIVTVKEKYYFICRTSLEQYDSEQMARDFLIQFANQIFTVGQQLAFSFQEKKVLSLIVKNLEGNFFKLLIKTY